MVDAIIAFVDAQVLERLRLHGRTFLLDAVIVVLAYRLADEVRFNGHVPMAYTHSYLLMLPFIVFVYGVANYLFGIHRRLWQYAGAPDMRSIVDASVISAALILAVDVLLPAPRPLPMSVVPAGAIFALFGFLGVRVWRRLRRSHVAVGSDWSRVLLVGAGRAGQLVASDLLANPDWREYPVAFVDDDPHKYRMRVHGIRVLGTVEQLADLVRELNIDIIGVAVPNASRAELDRILSYAQETDARIQILPSRAEVLERGEASRLRDISLDDLVRQTPANHAENPEVRAYLRERTVLVTGAAGSIGSELCRQILALGPKRLLALDNNESGLFYLQGELASHGHHEALSPILADVTDAEKICRVVRQYRPDVVFHAAAYKHVPMLEAFPEEAISVNITGTLSLCQAAGAAGCERFIFISTDKAVDPVNALGFSKRVGEMLVRAHGTGRTRFCCVRFGNVIGSRGSALPEFIRQIDAGGPVTVTHPDVERYFMTISEAVRLVIEAGTRAEGGELFMLDMGTPVKLDHLARRMIRARGLRIGKDIEVVYTGLRPGEKLTERLVFEHERSTPTDNPAILRIEDPNQPSLPQLLPRLDAMTRAARSGDRDAVFDLLAETASGTEHKPSVAS